MKSKTETLTPTDKKVIKYADLIISFIKNNYPQPSNVHAQKIKEEMEQVKAIVNDRANRRANTRLREQQLLNDKTLTSAEKKSLIKKIDAGNQLDETIAHHADALQVMYLSFLNKNNPAQA